jgi:hypothetical protein
VQLRPSMHYLDALDSLAQQEKRRAQAEPGEDLDEGSTTEDGGKGSSRVKEKKKAQSLSVSIRGDQGGGPLGARGKGAVADSRDLLMLADREAEGERWIDLDWKNETVRLMSVQLGQTGRLTLRMTCIILSSSPTSPRRCLNRRCLHPARLLWTVRRDHESSCNTQLEGVSSVLMVT